LLLALVQQGDPIQTAKLVAAVDQVSNGRFLFGVGGGWNQDEMEDHGTVVRNPLQADARADRGDEGDLDQVQGLLSRRHGQFSRDAGLAQTDAEALPADPGRRRLSAGRAPSDPLRRLVPGRPHRLQPADVLGQYRQMAHDAGRDRETLPVTLFSPAEDEGELTRYRDVGVARVVPMLLSEERDKILPILDRWAALIRRTAH
jgi:alkanesulfonate monooxygenase SsuD/methylene tetrahydromethanopterin reductase-like flavin-dependent oxidoreductase (luciferase family)